VSVFLTELAKKTAERWLALLVLPGILWVTALFVARYLPALAVPALVARVEASTRRRTLSALYAFEAACAALLAALVWHFLLGAILVLVALDGALELCGQGPVSRASTLRSAVPVTLPDGTHH